MMIKKPYLVLYIFFILLFSAKSQEYPLYKNHRIRVGAEKLLTYTPYLNNKRIAIVANQSSMVQNIHLVDTLHSLQFDIKKIFVPEHGFRGNVPAGKAIKNEIDKKTGIPIVSLYGAKKMPSQSDLVDVDIVLFDIQDVGARFYTYISTLTYVMEACAENGKLLIILDRPNPNGFYVDGPVLELKHQSFVGMHPIPIVHGLTMAELARMIIGEGWLKSKKKCFLQYVSMDDYSHRDLYQLPVKPSPNLPDMRSVLLYPSLCLFEGTKVSVGRGTKLPFQKIGYPGCTLGSYNFIPKKNQGSQHPKYENKVCNGFDFSQKSINELATVKKINLFYLIRMYVNYPDKNDFFTSFFTKLSGTEKLRQQIVDGWTEEKIRDSWQPDLDNYKKMRKKYLLYSDYE